MKLKRQRIENLPLTVKSFFIIDGSRGAFFLEKNGFRMGILCAWFTN